MDTKEDILERLGIEKNNTYADDARELCVRLYVNELKSGNSVKDHDQVHLIVKSCIDILKVSWPNITRQQCMQQLASLFMGQDVSELSNAIDISLRIWLMVDVRDDSVTGYPRRWRERETIEEVVRSRFAASPDNESDPIRHFPRHFRAVDLEKISGIIIQWTTYLDEHLRFDDENRTLKIFNNKPWLLAILECVKKDRAAVGSPTSAPSTKRCVTGLPAELLEETIRTLDVLFPPWHDRTVKFLDSLGQDFYHLPPTPRDLPRLREFSFWRERLIDVIVEFESPPRNWRYVWKDRRYPMAFWTFWLGLLIFILTFLFGFIGTLIAGLALRAAVKQLQMTAPA